MRDDEFARRKAALQDQNRARLSHWSPAHRLNWRQQKQQYQQKQAASIERCWAMGKIKHVRVLLA